MLGDDFRREHILVKNGQDIEIEEYNIMNQMQKSNNLLSKHDNIWWIREQNIHNNLSRWQVDCLSENLVMVRVFQHNSKTMHTIKWFLLQLPHSCWGFLLRLLSMHVTPGYSWHHRFYNGSGLLIKTRVITNGTQVTCQHCYLPNGLWDAQYWNEFCGYLNNLSINHILQNFCSM